MRTGHSRAGHHTAHPPPPPSIAPADHRQQSMLLVSLAAGLAAALSCADAPTSPRAVRRGTPVFLNATAAAAVRTVLADIASRIGDAIEDQASRASFEAAMNSLVLSLDAGMLNDADRWAASARASMAEAAMLDLDGSGDADRAAIGLALNVTDEEVTNARLAAGGQ